MKFLKKFFKTERKKVKVQNRVSDFFPQDEKVEKYSKLLKEATAHKNNNIAKAVNLIRNAILILKDYPISSKRQGIKKLADYERINGNLNETINILHNAYKEAIFSDEYFMRAMEASIFISYITTQTKKMKIEAPGLELESIKLHMVALAVQGRIDEISRIPQINSNFELKEFFSKNINKLNHFQESNSKEFDLDFESCDFADDFTAGATDNVDNYWRSNERINQEFFSIINEIDNKIENILTLAIKSISEK